VRSQQQNTLFLLHLVTHKKKKAEYSFSASQINFLLYSVRSLYRGSAEKTSSATKFVFLLTCLRILLFC
jgi:hypothetical protein